MAWVKLRQRNFSGQISTKKMAILEATSVGGGQVKVGCQVYSFEKPTSSVDSTEKITARLRLSSVMVRCNQIESTHLGGTKGK